MQDNIFVVPSQDQKAFCGVKSSDNIRDIRDPKEKNITTIAGLTGFYIRMLENALLENPKNKTISVQSSFNKEEREDLGNPIVLVKRNQINPSGLSMFGDKSPVTDDFFARHMQSMPGASKEDSYSLKEMFTADFSITVYGTSLAETTRIQEDIFGIMFGASFGVMSDIFNNIQYVTPPTATEVSIQERNLEIYIGVVMVTVHFIEIAKVISLGTIIKSARLAVRDLPVENILEFASE